LTENTSQPIKTRRTWSARQCGDGGVPYSAGHGTGGSRTAREVHNRRRVHNWLVNEIDITADGGRYTRALYRQATHVRTHAQWKMSMYAKRADHVHMAHSHLCVHATKTCTKNESKSLFRADNYWSISPYCHRLTVIAAGNTSN